MVYTLSQKPLSAHTVHSLSVYNQWPVSLGLDYVLKGIVFISRDITSVKLDPDSNLGDLLKVIDSPIRALLQRLTSAKISQAWKMYPSHYSWEYFDEDPVYRQVKKRVICSRLRNYKTEISN